MGAELVEVECATIEAIDAATNRARDMPVTTAKKVTKHIQDLFHYCTPLYMLTNLVMR